MKKKVVSHGYGLKRELRREQILKIASELFSEKSYHDVTVDEIAGAVGVAKGTIYLYFPSKERLYLEILEDSFEAIELHLEKEIAKSDSAPVKLKKVLRLIFEFYQMNLDVLRILSRDETHLIREHFEFTEHWRLRRIKLYEKILEKGQREGSFRPMNTKLVAIVIFGLVRSVMFYYKIDRSASAISDDVFSVISEGILDAGQKGYEGLGPIRY
ncbi:MAG: TetR/AcrR family transcriptional regulator [Thermodesulfobacteriota bacterium]